MLTSALITIIQREAQDWSRPAILSLIDEVQKMVYKQSTVEQMRLYDPATGKDPKFTVTSGVKEYNINTSLISGLTANAWRVCRVYANDIEDPEDVLLYEATPSTPQAKVVFKEDTSGEYYVRCYRAPATLSKEADQLEIPDGYHFTHVYNAVMGLIEMARSGKSDRWDKFEGKTMRELVKKLSTPNQSVTESEYRPAGL